jgi:hypothetical protein
MSADIYPRSQTGHLLVDPYNDFLAPNGKLWPRAKEVAEEVHLLTNLKPSSRQLARKGSEFSMCHITAGNLATMRASKSAAIARAMRSQRQIDMIPHAAVSPHKSDTHKVQD